MNYRREIDGLRAVAVLPVIFFHAGFQTFSGGFIGVDVFFVISGYLITSIIVAEQRAGTFTLLNFYERRARRILPALFVVMLACLPFAWLWMPPSEMKNFSQSLVAVSTFSSNLWLWLTSGYFEHDAELKPLLHTWSLAVEEQYYVFFPLFLMLMWRFGKRWMVATLVVMAVISLVSAQWISSFSQPTAFYVLPTRGWELLIGAFVAFYFLRDAESSFNKPISQIGSAFGLALIIYAVFAFDSHTPFPSFYTLIPTVGTALVILFATQKTMVGKLLGNQLFVGVGLISYSAYLWHQPLFAFARQRTLDDPSKLVLIGLAIAAFALAFFSWKYIEAPFRSKQRFNRKLIFLYGAAAAVFFIVLGVAGDQSKIKGLWQIENPGLITFSEPMEKLPSKDCSEEMQKRGLAWCKITGSGARRVVLWGDSHAFELSEYIPHIDGVELYSVVHYGCPPLIGVRRFDDVVTCGDVNILNNYADFIKSLSPDVVILAGRWTMYLHGWQKMGVMQPEHHFLSDSNTDSSIRPMADRTAMLQRQLEKTIIALSKNSKVILLAQPPDFAPIGFRRMERTDLSISWNAISVWHKEETDILESVRKLPNLTELDMKKLFCDDHICQTRRDGVLLYSDDNHLSARGAHLAWQMIIDELTKEANK